jgi:hypothetical protein
VIGIEAACGGSVVTVQLVAPVIDSGDRKAPVTTAAGGPDGL